MTPEIIEGVKNVIKKRIDDLEVLHLSFFGGEPLLNKTTIFNLSNWSQQLCKSKDVRYISSITTNGYLLDIKTFEELIKCNISSFQITIDGEKQTHDKFRPTLKGKSTFDEIYSNLVKMSDTSYNFNCTIRFNISDANFNSIKSFISNYSSPFTNDKRFSFHFHPIFGVSELRLTINERLKELTELAEIKGYRYDTPSGHSLCYASKANSYAIRADGRIQKCTVALESEINNVGKIDKDGNLNIDENKFKKWIFANNNGCPLQTLSQEKLVVPYEEAEKYFKETNLKN
jgi:uncharacterized protein